MYVHNSFFVFVSGGWQIFAGEQWIQFIGKVASFVHGVKYLWSEL